MDTRLTPMHELLQYAEDRNIAIGAFEFWSFEVGPAPPLLPPKISRCR